MVTLTFVSSSTAPLSTVNKCLIKATKKPDTAYRVSMVSAACVLQYQRELQAYAKK
jgi:hypothetical protein